MSMKTVEKILKKYIKRDAKIGVGLSGGPDSMALISIVINFFQQENFPLDNIFAIHCDHNIRPGSENEAKTIKQRLPKTINFKSYTINHEQSKNEANLREQRYNIFEQQIQQNDLVYFLLGHNLTDRIESTMMNLLRGCNLKGFLSIPHHSEHHLINCPVLRPLLENTKAEIQNYCDEQHINYITDESNTDSEFSLRNKIRNDILPEITKLSHKHNQRNNTFFESLKNIYSNLENCTKTNSIHCKNIWKPKYRDANFAYKVYLDPQQITVEECYQLFTQLHISNEITTATLNEFTNFFNTAKNSHKYLNGTYFFIINNELFSIQAPKDFWKKTVDNSQLITTLGTYELDGQTISIEDSKYLDHQLGYYHENMKFKGKTWNKYCINNKIPVFYRNNIPLIFENTTIKNYFYPFK